MGRVKVTSIEAKLEEAQTALGCQLIACVRMHEQGSAAQRRLAQVALGLACKAVWDLEKDAK